MIPLFVPTVTNLMASCIPDKMPQGLYVKPEAHQVADDVMLPLSGLI